jgi:uncharacterized protein (TIGR02246 family)
VASFLDSRNDVASMQNDEQQIRDVVATWLAASKAGDIDTVLGLMTDDVVFLVPGRAPMRRQEFATLSRVPPGAAPPQIDGRSEIQEVVVSGDVAFMWAKLSVVMTPPGGLPIERAGHTLTVLRRVNGRWLVARDANLLSTVPRSSANA